MFSMYVNNMYIFTKKLNKYSVTQSSCLLLSLKLDGIVCQEFKIFEKTGDLNSTNNLPGLNVFIF